MIHRINLILQTKNITAKQFAEEIGIQPSGMSHIMGGRNNPSLDFVHKVLRRYPEIDANWLLLGRGEMYSTPSPTLLPAAPSVANAPVAPPPTDKPQAIQPTAPTEPMPPSVEIEDEVLARQPWEEPPAAMQHAEPEPPARPSAYISPSSQPISVAEDSSWAIAAAADAPQLARVLFIYTDGTFDSYSPRTEADGSKSKK